MAELQITVDRANHPRTLRNVRTRCIARLSTLPRLLEITVKLLEITRCQGSVQGGGIAETQSHLFAGHEKPSRFYLSSTLTMSIKVFIMLSMSVIGIVNAATTYDQSQTGELNVQVDLKDIQIIALMKSGKEEYVDYDYAYDYSEMTIKPQNGTTPKPLNVSSTASNAKDNATVASTVLIETTTEYLKNNTESSLAAAITEQSTSESSTPTRIGEEITTKISEIAEPAPTLSVANVTICKKGFILNQKGGCDFKLQSASNALLKIIKLSQKLKRREHREEASSE